ncbi:hypothetical protein SETIT_2G034000v2 [Setaria italica]|uniref:Uncharacterized protein n=1 Tax=Setaria italica TaxID=4555 RepID=A0A368PUT6_SETIT|nr:glycine, alanine and asparagine-rich protein-like [Setaria italica]RCV09495.1 hypothetical protein SETIT_2G034000v2 [Setaria italica]
MGLPPPSITSAGKASARAHIMVVLAGAAPARTCTVALRPSLPFAAAGARFAGGGRGDGENGGGSARLAGAAMYTALRRPAAPAFKNSPFPSYGGAAVLCLARRADGEGDGDRGVGEGGAGAGDDDHGDGGAGAGGDGHGDGGDHSNAKKDYALNNGKGTEGAPAGDVGAGGDTEGAGAGKACNFNKGTDAAAAASGGGGHPADQACWEPMSLRWAFVQGLVTVFVLGFSLYIAFKIWFDMMVRKLAATYLNGEEIRILMSEAVKGVIWHATEPRNPVVRWKKMHQRNKFCVCGLLYFCCLYLLC